MTDWQVLCRIAREMGVGGFDFEDVEAIREEIAQVVPEASKIGAIDREPAPLEKRVVLASRKSKRQRAAPESEAFPFILTVHAVEHAYRGFPLSTWVEGSKMLLTEEVLEINPIDAQKVGVAPGEDVLVESKHTRRALPVTFSREQPEGTLRASLREYTHFNPNPQPVRIRKKLCTE